MLFADFAGFTAFTHRQDAEDVRDYMTSLWAQIDRIIAAHGGETEKHVGDAIMAIFGGRHAREEDPAQAVRAALAIQACLKQMRAQAAQSLEMRIGINTGLVVVGPLSTSGELTATGETVNVASRLEQNAPPSGILLSHDTYRHIHGLFDLQTQPLLVVKGKPEPLQTYLVLRAKPRALAEQWRGVEGVETKMIGRETELKRLQSALDDSLEDRESKIITIVGEAGIGKSCLLREFQKWVELLPQRLLWFYGRATAEMAGSPFSLMREIFCTRFDIQESDPPALAREKLESGLVALLRANHHAAGSPQEEAVVQAHFIGQLLGLDFSESPCLRDILHDPEQIRHRAFHYLSRCFNANGDASLGTGENSGISATLLVAEDLHWSDDGSLELIDHLARTCTGAPLIIVCSARPTLFERHSAWGEGLAAHSQLKLEPLSRQHSRQMVESILKKASSLPQALRELIVGDAEGNPFYIEEIIKMLIDQQVIIPGPQQWRTEPDRLAAACLPPTLTGVLQARLDGLSTIERTVLQRASVIGRVFWDSAVERLSSTAACRKSAEATAGPALSGAQVAEALAELRHKEIIFRRESSAFAGAVEYIFKHELLRNVSYESLLKKSRREYHGEVAAWLIQSRGERVSEFGGVVAGHFEQAGRFAEAADWYGRAAQQARAGYAPAIAIEYFRKALALLPAALTEETQERAKRLEWQEGLGEMLGAQAKFGEALEAYAELKALAQGMGDRVALVRAWNGIAFLHERQGRNRASVEAAERAEALARTAGEIGKGERLRALQLKGWAYYRLSDARAVLALADQTLKLCTESGNRRGMAISFKLHGVGHLQLGHYSEADHYFEQGLALCQELGDRRNAAAMLSNLGESARLRGDYQAATTLYQRALAISRQIGHRESEQVYLTNLSAALLGLGQFAEAEAQLRQVIALTANSKSFALSETYSFLSQACLAQGKISEAFESAQFGLSLGRESEDHLDVGIAWRALGLAAAARMRSKTSPTSNADREALTEADHCFAESLRVFRTICWDGEAAHTLQAWAQFDLQRGRTTQGRAKLEEARQISSHSGRVKEILSPNGE